MAVIHESSIETCQNYYVQEMTFLLKDSGHRTNNKFSDLELLPLEIIRFYMSFYSTDSTVQKKPEKACQEVGIRGSKLF